MSVRWQNRFLSPQRMPSLTITRPREYVCTSLGFSREVPAHNWGKNNLRSGTLKGARGTASRQPCHAPSRQHSSVPRRYPQLLIFPMGESESVWASDPPAMQDAAKETHLFLIPMQSTEVSFMTEGGERLGAEQGRFGMHQRDTDPANYSTDSIRKPAHTPLGMPLTCGPSQLSSRYSQCGVCLTQEHHQAMPGSLCVHAPKGGKGGHLLMAGEQV